jgi:hypothetical protein
LLQEGRLEAILSWCYFKDNNSIPSWIPDCATAFSRTHIQWLRRRKAAGSAPAQWSISQDNRYLTRRGFTFDSIHSISASLSENLPYHTESQKPNSSPSPTNTNPPHRYRDEKGLKTALWRALRQDHPYRRDTSKTRLDIRWIDWSALSHVIGPNIWHSMTTITSNVSWETFNSFRQTNTNFSIFGLAFRDIFPEMNPGSRFWNRIESEDLEYVELLNQMASDMHLVVLALTGRKLVTTFQRLPRVRS